MKIANLTETLVTPEMATRWVNTTEDSIASGTFHQRKVSERWVNKFATDMHNNNWTYTPYPIVIDKHGNIEDGQKRLRAIIKAGKPMKFLVYRNWSDNGGTGPRLIEAVDKGQTRSILDTMRLNGLKYAYQVVPTLNYITRIATCDDRLDQTYSTAMTIYKDFGLDEHINAILEVMPTTNQKCGRLIGPMAWARTFNKERAEAFAKDYAECVGAPRSPVSTFSKWERNHVGHHATETMFRGLCSALRAQVKNVDWLIATHQREAVVWLSEQNPDLRAKIRSLYTARNPGVVFTDKPAAKQQELHLRKPIIQKRKKPTA